MTSVFSFRPEFGYAARAELEGRRLVLWHAPLIHRLIWPDRLYFPDPIISRRYSPELLPLCLDGEVVGVGVRHKQSLCLAHVVVGLVHQRGHISTVLA